jgi:sugar phosphate isomerase/epimerase
MATRPEQKMPRLSYQLYSSREFPPLSETLKMLKAAGYSEVEGYGGVYEDPKGLAKLMKEIGLTMPTGHFSIDVLEKEPQKALDIAGTLGMKAVYCPYLLPDQRPADGKGWRAFGARLQKAGDAVRKAGLVFGWHNHDFEFKKTPDGAMPQEEIFLGGPDLTWEADIAWIVRGGADPIEWIDRHGNRITAVHVKDIARNGENADEDGWADVGYGIVDWKYIWKALEKTPATAFILEHDKPKDHKRFATRSFAIVSKL